MNTTFNKEFGAGYHVSIVRLYEEKNATNKEAKTLKLCSDKIYTVFQYKEATQ